MGRVIKECFVAAVVIHRKFKITGIFLLYEESLSRNLVYTIIIIITNSYVVCTM